MEKRKHTSEGIDPFVNFHTLKSEMWLPPENKGDKEGLENV